MFRNVFLFLGFLASCALISVTLIPILPPRSQAVSVAYAKYHDAPSDQTRRDYQQALDRANRPIHMLQYISGASGLALLLVLVWIWRGQQRSPPFA